MYKDYFTPLEGGVKPPCTFIAVITKNERVRPNAVLTTCERYGATSEQSEGKCYWILFEDEPRRPWSFTEEALRLSTDEDGYIKCDSYDPKRKETRSKEELAETPFYMFGESLHQP
jgi:hypothetical protein